MKKYFTYLKLEVDCNCAIACGEKLIELEAKTFDEAYDEIKEYYLFRDGDYPLVYEIKILEVVNIIDAPVEEWYKEKSDKENIGKEEIIKQEELLLLKKLKEKYEK